MFAQHSTLFLDPDAFPDSVQDATILENMAMCLARMHRCITHAWWDPKGDRKVAFR
jgi:hypothetical protein